MKSTEPRRIVVLITAGVAIILAAAFGKVALAYPAGSPEFYRAATLTGVAGLCLGLSGIFLILVQRVERMSQTQKWLINAVNWNIQRLKAHGLAELPDEKSERQGDIGNTGVAVWPWGSHHTELLGHMDAAARHFWRLYDPGDPSTAPTNDMVADWLHSERGTSKEKAKSIASILRADGLPTGPRR